MKAATILFLSGASSAFAVDALSSVENLFGSRGYDPEEFSDRDLDEEKRFAPISPADSDLGDQIILARESGRAKPRLDLQSHLFWSDNLASTGFNEEEGFFWQNRADLSWRPRVGDNLFVDSFFEAESYLFDGGDDLDFQSYTLGLGVVKIIHDLDDLLLYGRYEFQHLSLDAGRFAALDDNVSYQRLRVGAHKVFLSKPRHTAYAALDLSFGLDSSESLLERDEYALHLGYTYHATDDLKASFFYRIASRDFREFNRNDILQTSGIELTYSLTRHLSLFASALWSDNDSDLPGGGFDYQSTQLGVGIGYSRHF